MNLQGDFEGLNLTGIFQLLHNDQKTGFLRVTKNDKESRVYFHQGTIVYATSSSKKDRIGFLMINDGIISDRQLKESLILARDTKQALGKILVEKGYISIQTLEKYNTRQVETIIYNLLFWEKGRFEYKDVTLNLKRMITTCLNPMKLILEASRRMDEMPVISKDTSDDRADDRAIEKKNPPDNVTPIIKIFDDMFQMIRKHIHQEIGEHAALLFDECKQDVDPLHRIVLGAYHPDNQIKINIRLISDAIEKEKITRGRSFLIDAFSQYCAILLKRIGDILGTYQVNTILKEIQNFLEYIKKYQTGSDEKTQIINNMKGIMDKAN